MIAWFTILSNHNQIHFCLSLPFRGDRLWCHLRVATVGVSGQRRRRSPFATLGNGDDEAITSEPSEEQDTPAISRERFVAQ